MHAWHGAAAADEGGEGAELLTRAAHARVCECVCVCACALARACVARVCQKIQCVSIIRVSPGQCGPGTSRVEASSRATKELPSPGPKSVTSVSISLCQSQSHQCPFPRAKVSHISVYSPGPKSVTSVSIPQGQNKSPPQCHLTRVKVSHLCVTSPRSKVSHHRLTRARSLNG